MDFALDILPGLCVLKLMEGRATEETTWLVLCFVLLNRRQFGRFHVTVGCFSSVVGPKRRKSLSDVLSQRVFGRHRPFGMLMRDYGTATVVIRELFVRLTCATARLKHPLNYPH